MAYTVQTKIASRGYHVYKNVNWGNAKEGDKVTIEIETDKESKKIDPYCCSIKAMIGNPKQIATVGHIPREISRHVYYFLKEEGGKVDGFVFNTKYRPSPIPSGGLEIPLMLSFKSPRYVTHTKMKGFLDNLYNWDYEPEINDSENEGEEETIEIAINEEDSEVLKPKKKRKPPRIEEESSDEDQRKGEECEDSEVLKPKKKMKPPRIEEESSDEDQRKGEECEDSEVLKPKKKMRPTRIEEESSDEDQRKNIFSNLSNNLELEIIIEK